MMKMLSLKPYLIRAYYEWICESGGTPHLLVQADLPNVNVPGEYIDLDDYTILLNISSGATNQFLMGKNAIYFQARFSGVVCDIQVPYYAIMSLYAEENELGIVFDIDIKHYTTCSKDRTGLFMGKPEFIISEKTGETILNWCNSGAETTLEEAKEKIKHCESIEGLKSLYSLYTEWREELNRDFTNRKKEIEFTDSLLNPQNFSVNGSHSTTQ